WRLCLDDMTFAFGKTSAARFLEARRLMSQRGLPRYVFVRTSGEKKPVYVDFESPIYVELLAKLVRQAREKQTTGTVDVTEMLPTPEQCWLVDCEGKCYTSEVRMACVDLAIFERERGEVP